MVLIKFIVNDDLEEMDILRRLNNEEILSLARTILSAKVNRGGTKFGIIKLKKVKALCN